MISTKTHPLVSVIINNYNYGYFLNEAIDSVINQTYSHIEIVVVDDGSTDNSREIIANYKDKVISVLKENGGQASAFNAGFAASSGEIICMLDSDDVFLPNKIEVLVNTFAQYHDIGWCFHRLKFVNAQTGAFVRLSRESGSKECDLRAQIKKNGNIPFYGPATSGLCFKRTLLQLVLPMPEIITITSDNYIKIAALALSKGYFLDEQLALLRLHANNNYTERPNNKNIQAKVAILTAYCLKNKWLFLSKHTNKLLSRGIGLAWTSGGIETEVQPIVKDYLANISLKERIYIRIKALYHCVKV